MESGMSIRTIVKIMDYQLCRVQLHRAGDVET